MLDTSGVQAVCMYVCMSDLTCAICPTGSTLPVYRPPYKFGLHISRRVAGGGGIGIPATDCRELRFHLNKEKM